MPQKQTLQTLEVLGNAIFHGKVQMKNDEQWIRLSSRVDSISETLSATCFSQSEIASISKDVGHAKVSCDDALKRAQSSEKASGEASKKAEAAEKASGEASKKAEAAEKASGEASKKAEAAEKAIAELKKQIEALKKPADKK
jgi:predicted  nucleic acid-binding Zn-ribbon protein